MRDDEADSVFHLSLFWASCSNAGIPRLIHSLMFSVQLFLCLPLHLPPSKMPNKMSLDKVSWRVMWPNHASFFLFTIAQRGSCGPANAATLCQTNSLVLCSVNEMLKSFRQHFNSKVWIFLSVSAVKVQLSHPQSRIETASGLLRGHLW